MAMSVDAKLLKQTRFPPQFNQKVDMKKVNVEVMKKWIAGKISEILGNDDDVVVELCFNLLEGSRFPDIKVLQIQLTGFLDKDTPNFCKELWTLCLSAQSNPQGVPKELLEAKKLELIQEKIEAEKAAEEANKRKEQETRERNIEFVRQRERGERGRGRGRGDRGNRDYDRRPPRDSRSPPPRRRSPPRRADYHRGPPPRRELDTYVPRGRDARRQDDRRHRSNSVRMPISRSPSRSRTPLRLHRRRDDERPRSRRRRYTPSRSPTPVRRMSGWDGGRRNRGRGDRARSFELSEPSRSRSPRRNRRRRSPSISSHSRTPPPSRTANIRRRRSSPVISRSRSRSLGRDRRRSGRGGRSPSHITDHVGGDARADYRKDRRNYDERRHSRSRSRNGEHRGAGPAPVAPSRSLTPDKRRDRKRHRSIQRYAPAGRRRRNSSSVSSPNEKRRKMADSSGDEGITLAPEPLRTANPKAEKTPAGKKEESQSPTLTSTELRERLLREKVMAMRKGNAPKAPKTEEVPLVVLKPQDSS